MNYLATNVTKKLDHNNAIIDRIAHDSYRINITSIDAEHDISMREVYGLDKALRE